jgi:hypothetical protein
MKLELTKNELDYIQNSLNQYGQTLFNETIEKHRNGEETSPELIAHTLEGNILHTKITNLIKGAN